MVRDFLGVHNIVVQGNRADGTPYAVERVSDEGFLLPVHFLRGYQSDRGGFVFFKGFVDGGLFRGGGSGSGADAGNRGIGCGDSRLRCGNGGGFSLFIVAHVNIQAQKAAQMPM